MLFGSDIVDLQADRSHDRFYQRITSDLEKAAFTDSSRNRAILWAAKEAAYKAVSREQPRSFIPSQIEVSADLNTVIVAGSSLQLYIKDNLDYVYAHCYLKAAPIFKIAQRNSQSESCQVRSLALAMLGEAYDPQNFCLMKNFQGAPFANSEGSSRQIPLSYSHHGRFIACTMPQLLLGVNTTAGGHL